MSSPDNATTAHLKAIAAALQIPLDQLVENAATCELDDANECLRLWCLLKTTEGRGRALAALRAVADGEAA
ncbi:hypothetical protein ASF28_02330 [Methylobacterium sp. Leaf99]|uniref:hypothetical protein n=1 Tax=Methylobacterium sp. Leaf99 TaxID=1736251 RepID=UPI0006FCED54|nr:hypothetical protein [Methylobacterium sp. Leaf99]KQP10023.1 hypothetical protein ASF28_02330 [Methylobacterium sp. Leaf99]